MTKVDWTKIAFLLMFLLTAMIGTTMMRGQAWSSLQNARLVNATATNVTVQARQEINSVIKECKNAEIRWRTGLWRIAIITIITIIGIMVLTSTTIKKIVNTFKSKKKLLDKEKKMP